MGKKYLPNRFGPGVRTEKLNSRMRNQKPGICIERARLITESDCYTKQFPPIMKRALDFKYILENMRVYILEDELIVGHHAAKLRYAPLFPEISILSKKELDLLPIRKVDTLQLSTEDKKYLLEDIYPYWNNRKQSDIAINYFPKDLLQELNYENRVFNPISRIRSGYGHYVPDFPTVLKKGFKGIAEDAKEYLDNLSELDITFVHKYLFYKSIIIICQAAKIFAERYAKLAEEMAGTEKDENRKQELKLIAAACQRVPYYPARSFHEALQAYWFTLLMDYIFQNGSAISAGRFDQYMYPYYQADFEAGKISREDGMEFLEALLVQHLDIIKAGAYNTARNNGGFATTIHMTIGGLNQDGQDVTNDLSYMVMEADQRVFNSEPNIGLRVSSKTPDKLLNLLLENLVANEGGKYPIFNDDAIISAFEKDGVTREDALDYCVVGCVEPTPSGNTMGITNACFFNIAKCLELALNNGVDMLNGDQMGMQTGKVEDMHSFEDVWQAFIQQMDYFTRKTILSMNIIAQAISDVSPHVFCSAILKDCLQKGLDSVSGGAKYNYVGIQGVGLIDAADSLYTIKKLVFDEQQITLSDLRKALLTNFSGEEKLLQYILNKVEKYGNDIEEVDSFAQRVAETYCNLIRRGKDPRGGKYRAGLYCLSSNTPIGKQTAALPNGRLARTPLADGGVSPKQGMDVCGPTAAIKSVSSLDHSLALNGTNYNQKYLHSIMMKQENRKKLIQLIRTYFSLNGFQIQLNILDPKTLRAAQKNPEKYRSLVVRVAGYSAFFVELDTEIQNEIISRTELSSL